MNEMNIRYENVNDILSELHYTCPPFSLFNDRGNVIKVSYWQPYAELEFERESGVHCCSENHSDKAKEFLKKAREKKPDIVMTPEYSVPWEVLYQLFQDDKLWPCNMKLWCLGMEGISYEQLKKFQQFQAKNTKIIMEDLDQIYVNDFFSCIAYLFVTQREDSKANHKTNSKADRKTAGSYHLICLIQIKTTPASDEWAKLESNGLSTGNTIYYFEGQQTNNYLFSYICADALNQKVFQANELVKKGDCIILHPQLNPKPLHDSFEQMRKSFLDYTRNSIRILSVNWAKDTSITIKETGETISIKDSYSACYYNYILNHRELSELMRNNKKKGINLAKLGHIFCWYMPANEHCMIFTIDNFKTQMLNNAAAKHNEPVGDIYAEYNDQKKTWENKAVCEICIVDWQWLNEVFQIESCNNSCPIIQLHKFFSILFGNEMYKLLEIKDKQLGIIFNLPDSDTEDVKKGRERCKFVSEAIAKGILPQKFAKYTNGNYKWILSDDGNLTNQEDMTSNKKPTCVLYVDSSIESIIQQKIINFQTLMGEDAMDRLLVYCMSIEGIKVYDQLNNEDVNNPELTKNICNINVG